MWTRIGLALGLLLSGVAPAFGITSTAAFGTTGGVATGGAGTGVGGVGVGGCAPAGAGCSCIMC